MWQIIANYFFSFTIILAILVYIRLIKKLNIKYTILSDFKKEFSEDFNKEMKILNEQILKYQIISKQYYEMFSREFTNHEAVDLAQLQYEQNIAIEEEDYERAGAIQKEIDILILKDNNETIKDNKTNNTKD